MNTNNGQDGAEGLPGEGQEERDEQVDQLSQEDGGGLVPDDPMSGQVLISGMYENWFMDYASYVILERAVPAIEDGFKPVQRRILHAMKEMDDGRYNKVANIIGQTMQYHPHGDASIADAIVNLGQKDLLIDTQGNWGDVRTGDGAAAPRYIEARLSKFALDVTFNPQTTEWQLSYDGRKREPVTLPVKFPLLLAQGVEGIAVGLSTKIMPHNFIELLHACIADLKGEAFELYPDFYTGGLIDVSDYGDGKRGGKIRVRATIEELDKKTLVIKDIPYGTTTTSLIDSIIKANDKGKIKIKKVVDNTAKDVEIQVQLAAGQSPDITTGALYAFTDCEVSISPNACIIINDKPHFLGVSEVLRINNKQTVALLKRELEIKRGELLEKLLFASLEKIFIENRIYRDIEECETWEAVIETIDKGLDPYKPQFYREITRDDIIKLTEIKIKRISRFDSFKADELMRKLEEELKQTEYNLAHLTEFAIQYYQQLLEKYGKGRERKTMIKPFDNITATVVAANNAKLYVNRKDGFIGTGLKKDEFVSDCSDIDDIVCIKGDGTMVVVRIADKVFVGKDVLYVGVVKKNDDRMVYNLLYRDGTTGRSRAKRFQLQSFTRDKQYDLTRGEKGSKILYFTANPNGEAEVVGIQLAASSRARVKAVEYDFAELDIKGRGAQGNIVSRYPIRKVALKREGVSTLGGVDIYYDTVLGRLNTDKRGKLLGNFDGDDKILAIGKDGQYELTTFELTNRYEPNNLLLIEKFDAARVVSAVYYDGGGKSWYVKRFKIETTSVGKKFLFISEGRGSKLVVASTFAHPQIEVVLKSKEGDETKLYDLDVLIDVKGWKAIGNRLTTQEVKKMTLVDNPDAEKEAEAAAKAPSTAASADAPATGSAYTPGSTVDLNVSKNSNGKDDDNDEQLGLF